MMVLAATINHQVAYRKVMIPLLAENLRKAGAETNLHDIFLSTSECIKSEKPSQSPEFRSTMRYKICLKKTFNPDYRYYSKLLPPKHDDGCVLAQSSLQVLGIVTPVKSFSDLTHNDHSNVRVNESTVTKVGTCTQLPNQLLGCQQTTMRILAIRFKQTSSVPGCDYTFGTRYPIRHQSLFVTPLCQRCINECIMKQ